MRASRMTDFQPAAADVGGFLHVRAKDESRISEDERLAGGGRRGVGGRVVNVRGVIVIVVVGVVVVVGGDGGVIVGGGVH